MTMMRASLLVLVLVFAAIPRVVAQSGEPASTGPRVFVSGGAFADEDGTWGTPASTIGFSGAVGADVGRHTDIRLLVDLPRTVTLTWENGRLVEQHRSRSWSVLVGLHGKVSDRFRVGVIAGVATAEHYWTQIGSQRISATYTWNGFTAGMEVPISLTNHLFVVPEVRLVWFPLADYGRTTITRPGVSLRWRF